MGVQLNLICIKVDPIESDHLYIDSKLPAKFHKLNASGSLDILLTIFSFSKMPESVKGRNSAMKNLTEIREA